MQCQANVQRNRHHHVIVGSLHLDIFQVNVEAMPREYFNPMNNNN